MRLQHLIEQHEAASCGAVVAGAERQRRLDLDAELVRRYFRAVMAAVDDEAPGADRYELIERRLDPVFCLDGIESDVPRDLIAGRETDEFADRTLIGRLGKMHGDIPAPPKTLECGDRGLALKKTLGQEIDDAFRGLFAADREAGAVGGRGQGRIHSVIFAARA